MFNSNHIPNLITLLRFILTVPLVFFIIQQQYHIAVVLFAIASITDALDGWVAKKFNYQSVLGSKIDPLADKILLLSSFIVLFYNQLIPIWLVITIFLRDFILITGVVILIDKNTKFTPSLISKINTILQIICIALIMFAQIITIPAVAIKLCFAIVFFTTIASGFHYIYKYFKK